MKQNKYILSVLSVMAIALFPCFYLYFHNIGTAEFTDLIETSVIITLISFSVLIVYMVWFREIRKASLITNITMGIFLYFSFIENGMLKIFPMIYYWHVALICLFVLIQIAILINKKLQPENAAHLNEGLFIIFTGLIVLNGVLAIPKSVNATAQNLQQIEQDPSAVGAAAIGRNTTALPNVYYFIFDEYGGLDSVARYCNYDNSEFYDTLEQMGFVTSRHAINGTIDSYTEVPNLLQLQNINTIDMTATKKKENLKNPYLLKLMKDYGYTINALDSTNYHFIDKSLADMHFTLEFTSTYGTFESYIFQNTAYYPFYGRKEKLYEIKSIEGMFDYIIESSKKGETRLFTIGYFSFPHIPYIVDENGNKTSDADRLNLSDSDAYLGQFIYASKKITQMANEIINNDPDALIIIQSDHGYRLPSHLHFWYGIDQYDLEVESPYERNILNAVYYKGEEIKIEGLSGLNTLRAVLNQVLGTNFEMINP